MPFSQAMQSSSSTIALQPLTSRWSLDSDDYCIHSKNYHRLYPPPHAKLSHLKSVIEWPKKSSPPISLPYVTLCATPYWNSDLYFPSSHSHFRRPLFRFYHFSVPSSNFCPFDSFWNFVSDHLSPSSLFLPVFPIHPDCETRNPISDLLIPPCCTCFPTLFSVVIKASY